MSTAQKTFKFVDPIAQCGSGGSLPHCTTRAAVATGVEQTTCAAGFIGDETVSSLAACSAAGVRQQVRAETSLTDSFSVSMVFTKSERAGAVWAVIAKERDVVR